MADATDRQTNKKLEREKLLVAMLLAQEAFLAARCEDNKTHALAAARVYGDHLDQYLGRTAPTNGGQNGK